MPLYQYKARDKNGALLTEKIRRGSAEEIKQTLRAQGHTPVHIKKVSIFSYELSDLKQGRRRLSKKQAAIFCRQFSYMYGAGIPVTEALRIMAGQAEGRFMKTLFEDLSSNIEKGSSLWEAAAYTEAFPEFLVSMAEAGEMSGRTEEIFERLALYYEKEAKLSESLSSALSYPALISFMLIIVILAALLFLLPNYAAVYEANAAELPVYTEVLITFSRFVSGNYLLLIALFILGIAALGIYLRTEKGRSLFSKILLRLPVFGRIYKKSYTIKFVQVLSMLFDSGLPVGRSLYMAKKVLRNPYLGRGMDRIIADVEKGEGLGASAYAAGMFEAMAVGMLRVGEESGRLPEVLKKCGEYLEKDMEALLEKSGKMVEPVLLLGVGLILGFIMLAVMLPSFDLANIL